MISRRDEGGATAPLAQDLAQRWGTSLAPSSEPLTSMDGLAHAPELVVLGRAVAKNTALAGDDFAVAPAQDVSHVDVELLVRIVRAVAGVIRHVARIIVVGHDGDRAH